MNIFSQSITLPATMGGNRTPIIDQNHLEKKTNPWVEEYHMHLMNGGVPCKKVPNYLRRITVEEAAAIQTFPLGIHFAGSSTAQYRQIGNAVPPCLAYHVGLSVYNAIKNNF